MARIALLSAIGAIVVLSALPASAQGPRPGRPYRGLFGGGTGDMGQVLTASASTSAGWDDNLQAAARGNDLNISNPRGSVGGGTLGNLNVGLSYSLQADAVSFAAGASTSARYFPTLDGRIVRASQGRVSVSGSPHRNTGLSLSATVSHQPYSLLGLFPGVSQPSIGNAEPVDPEPDLDATVNSEARLSYSASAGISRQLARRTSASASYSYRLSERPDQESDFSYQRAGVRLTHQISSGLSAYAGYGYGQGRVVENQRHPQHSIDGGLQFNRPLSLTRRTTFSFSTGAAATRSRERLRFHLTGGAQLVHEIGRSWAAWTAYGRSVQYNEGWREPGLGNAVTFGIGGLITRRLQFGASGRYAIGTVGVEDDAPGFDSYYGNATLSYALARFASVSLSYAYYHHRFDDNVILIAGYPRSLDRQSVRASVNLWAPLFQRARRNDASR
jgi:hypothetical protein